MSYHEAEPIGEVLKRLLPEIEKRVEPKDRQASTTQAVGAYLAGKKPKYQGPPE